MELCDDEKLTAVFLEGQVAEPLEDLWHLLGAPVKANRDHLLNIMVRFIM